MEMEGKIYTVWGPQGPPKVFCAKSARWFNSKRGKSPVRPIILGQPWGVYIFKGFYTSYEWHHETIRPSNTLKAYTVPDTLAAFHPKSYLEIFCPKVIGPLDRFWPRQLQATIDWTSQVTTLRWSDDEVGGPEGSPGFHMHPGEFLRMITYLEAMYHDGNMSGSLRENHPSWHCLFKSGFVLSLLSFRKNLPSSSIGQVWHRRQGLSYQLSPIGAPELCHLPGVWEER